MAIYMWREKVPEELCFTANTTGSTIQLIKNWSPTSVSLQTSTDWNIWNTYTFGSTITLSNIGDKVYFRNTSEIDTGFTIDSSNYYRFEMSWSVAASWDINYLLNKNWTNTLTANRCFYWLFYNCTALTTAPKLSATTLTERCYFNMFSQCANLITAPDLPATTLTERCYAYMFDGCTSLTTPSEIKATILNTLSCWFMYQWCTALETLPKLPATTLWQQCYRSMFINCSKIKLSSTQTWAYQTAYRIPATWTWTDGSNSLYAMFDNTWWTFTWTPTINTTYYTSNTVV